MKKFLLFIFAAFTFAACEQAPSTNEIWYTATAKVEPTFDDALTFGADIVSNVWDSETKRGVISFDGDVTMIGEAAFNSCSSLTSITIPDSVTTIGDGAFAFCDSLTEFKGKFAKDNGRILVNDGQLIALAPADVTEYTIPDNITSIGSCAFSSCRSLISVTIPDSVTEIGRNPFAFCYSLTEFKGKFAKDNGRIWVIDGKLIAFAPAGVTEYTIPDNITSIESYAFGGCNSITSVTIPDSVTTIGYQAFQYCNSLTSVYCKATTPPTLGEFVFNNNGSGRKIYVPAASVEAYKGATNWSAFASAIVGYDFENGVVVE